MLKLKNWLSFVIALVLMTTAIVPTFAAEPESISPSPAVNFDLNSPERQEQVLEINGQQYTIVLGEAKRMPTPRFSYDLDEGEGSWSREVSGTAVVLNIGYVVYYTIGSDNKVTIDSLSDEYITGAFISVVSEALTIVRAEETSSSSAYCYYKVKATLETGLPILTETVNLKCNFKSGKLKVDFTF